MVDVGGIGVVVGQPDGAGGIGNVVSGGMALAQLWVISRRVEHAGGLQRLLSLPLTLFSTTPSFVLFCSYR